MISGQDFVNHVTEQLSEYYGTTNRPVTLVRAETDLLVRLTTQYGAILGARVRAIERSEAKDPDRADPFGIEKHSAMCDLALITSIARKLRESEK